MFSRARFASAHLASRFSAYVLIFAISFPHLANGQDPTDTALTQATYEPTLSTHSASNYLLKLSTYELEVGGTPGGGIADVEDAHIIVSGDGSFFVYRESGSSDGAVEFKSLPYRAPMNTEAFVAAAESYSENSRRVNTGWFRVNDVVAADLPGRTRLVVSHDFWNDEDDCVTVRLSYADVQAESFLEGSAVLDWRLLYETAPCVGFKSTGHPFGGMQTGGKMTMLPDKRGRLLVAFGDLEFDGVNSELIYAQDAKTSYGKVVAIDMYTGRSRRLTMGHRSPAGLHADKEGRIWLTEHGPQGGDELNLIVNGANYGWPLVTQGTQYQTYSWPLSNRQSEHDGYQMPTFSWVPSIGISDVISLQGNLLSVWRGDLLVASLKAGTLYRVRVRDGKTLFVEPIPIGTRIRDLVETDRGELLLWTDSGSVISIEPVDNFDEIGRLGSDSVSTWSGETLFRACQGCHTKEQGQPHGIGPNLWNIFGKDIASSPGYSYSKSLSEVSGVWDAANLDAFLANPQAFSAGNAMIVPGLTNAIDRWNLISYLEGESANKIADGSEIVQIEYESDSAGTVYLTWGIDGWKPLPSDALPPGTKVWDDNIMHTSMALVENTFLARIAVPKDSVVDYGFLIVGRKDGSKVSIWDGDFRLNNPVEPIVTIDGIKID